MLLFLFCTEFIRFACFRSNWFTILFKERSDYLAVMTYILLKGLRAGQTLCFILCCSICPTPPPPPRSFSMFIFFRPSRNAYTEGGTNVTAYQIINQLKKQLIVVKGSCVGLVARGVVFPHEKISCKFLLISC